MPALAVVVDTLKLKEVTDRILLLDAEKIGGASLSAVNEVAQRTYDESRRRMIARVNLTDAYVRERMDVEAANDARKPEATIIAFRSGGRRKGLRPVNLRQYRPLNEVLPARQNPTGRKVFRMRDGRLATYPVTQNPRAADKRLPFILRTGSPLLNIPLGQKPGKLTVEVLRGSRKVVGPKNGFAPFMQRMRNGQMLVMRRTDKNGGKNNKGSIEALYSLSVWQLFRRTSAEVVPLVQNDLEKTVGRAVVDSVSRALG